MKIAYHRYNQNTDLDYAIASVSSRNTEERLGILEALVMNGHKVTITSHISEKHRHVLNGESEIPELYNNDWASALRWDMDADMDRFDLLIVETAANNTLFGFTHPTTGKHMKFIAHFAEVLKRAKGMPVVIYHHGAGGLAFPFSRLHAAMGDTWDDVKDLSENNFRRIFFGMDIWEGYEYTLWTKAIDSKLFLESYPTYYDRPELNIARFVSTRIGYSQRYDKRLPTRTLEDTEFDLVYVGSAAQKARLERFKQFYDTDRYSSLIVGKGWSDLEWDYPDQLEMPGQSGAHGDVHTHYQRGVACVQLLNPLMAACGMQTTRHIQAIRAGSICMEDVDIIGAEDVVGKEFVVENSRDVAKILDDIEDGRDDMLKQMNEYQDSLLVPWTEIVEEVLAVGIGNAEGDIVK